MDELLTKLKTKYQELALSRFIWEELLEILILH